MMNLAAEWPTKYDHDPRWQALDPADSGAGPATRVTSQYQWVALRDLHNSPFNCSINQPTIKGDSRSEITSSSWTWCRGDGGLTCCAAMHRPVPKWPSVPTETKTSTYFICRIRRHATLSAQLRKLSGSVGAWPTPPRFAVSCNYPFFCSSRRGNLRPHIWDFPLP